MGWMGVGGGDLQRCLREEVSECVGEDVVWRIHVCIRKRFKWRAEQQRRDQGREWELQADKERERGEERAETSSTPASICRRSDPPEHSC